MSFEICTIAVVSVGSDVFGRPAIEVDPLDGGDNLWLPTTVVATKSLGPFVYREMRLSLASTDADAERESCIRAVQDRLPTAHMWGSPTEREMLVAAGEYIDTLTRERDEAIRERDRLAAWLSHIDGGDAPCTDESQLRQWAYEAVTLGHPAPGTES